MKVHPIIFEPNVLIGGRYKRKGECVVELQDKFHMLDQLYLDRLKQLNDRDRWLLEQTVYTASSRRGVLSLLPITSGMDILDIGSGFGPVAFELAAMHEVSIVGIDADEDKIQICNELLNRLSEGEFLCKTNGVSFTLGDVYSLPFPDASFDFIVGRLIFQHLDSVARAVGELHRVLRVGGRVCVIDVDDDYNITYPESKIFNELYDAFALLQKEKGGDRFIGKKLSSYLADSGFEIESTVIIPQSGYSVELGLSFAIRRFQSVKQEIIQRRIMSESKFNSLLNQLRSEENTARFISSARVLVLGKKAV